MTWLDLVCGLFLALVAVGGYAQGLIRGVARLGVLLGGGALGALVVLQLGSFDTAAATAGWAAAIALLALGGTGLVGWSMARIVPRFMHAMLANRLLGVLPALLAGLVILALVLALAERLAVTSETQAFIRSGVVTGPLVSTVDLVEQLVAGVR